MTTCRACINEFKAPCQKGFYNIVISCYLQSMRAIITRHYKTIINASDQILGWGDSPRDKGWRADVEYVNSRLREQEISFDAVYSSDLERSRQIFPMSQT